MLKSLSIRNYAIIDDIAIDFDRGFHVFTGETGAGKSIIVGALSLLLKGRGDSSAIRHGANRASVEGVFSMEKDIEEKLEEAMIDHDGDLVVRRVLSADGRNVIKVNDTTVTLSFLEDLLEGKVDIHSQKDSLYLFKASNHLKLLDRYANTAPLLREYEEKYQRYLNAQNELQELQNGVYSERELEYLRYDLDELEKAGISVEEQEELLRKERRYKDSEKYITTLNAAVSLYEEEKGIRERFHDLVHSLNLEDDGVLKIREDLHSLYYTLEDEMEDLKKILSSFTDEDLDIDRIEERLFLYSRLKRKHSCDIQGLIDKTDSLRKRLAVYEDRDAVLAEKEKEVLRYQKEAEATALAMRDLRKQKALSLEERVMRECRDLVLDNADFRILFEEIPLSKTGMDKVEFYVSMNKGEERRPLKNVVSGGEASRLLLALKCVFTDLSDTSLIIFDEIDSGVSGRVAFAVGSKMASISQNIQTIAITHLAPVAAFADHHHYVYKQDINEHTITHVKTLTEKERIEELASISSGINEESLKAAKILLEQARKKKGS